VRSTLWIGASLALALLTLPVRGQQALPEPFKPPGPLRLCPKKELVRLNLKLNGQVLDFTHNHDADRRIYSPALDEKRDLYVYLPPAYDPCQRYPLLIWLHGILQDERAFLDIVRYFDVAMASGALPPFVIAAPDGSITGRPSFRNAGSFYVNSNAGRFEDFIACDVWNFVIENFSIRPEREAHVMAGASMGGFGAYNLGIKYRDRFAIVIGVSPALNLRYVDCHGTYFAPFDPNCTGYNDRYHPHRVVGNFWHGMLRIREHRFVDPLYGRSPAVIDELARESPIEMLDSYDVKRGELAMFVGYGTCDEFNLMAHGQSFAYHAAQRGLAVTVYEVPGGGHSSETGIRMYPTLVEWLAPQLRPYAPPVAVEPRVESSSGNHFLFPLFRR
jgi:S-formylglutathione hydrolase FrmB